MYLFAQCVNLNVLIILCYVCKKKQKKQKKNKKKMINYFLMINKPKRTEIKVNKKERTRRETDLEREKDMCTSDNIKSKKKK